MVKVVGVENSPSIQTVRKWVREFKEGRSDCRDVKRPGRPAAQTKQSTAIKDQHHGECFQYEETIISTWKVSVNQTNAAITE